MKLAHISFFIFIFIALSACREKAEPAKVIDLEQIKARGYIIAYTQNNSTGYFIYKGETMGFQYELLEKFVKHLGVKLKIITGSNDRSVYDSLNTFACDIVAMRIPKSEPTDSTVVLTARYGESRLVLVQRKPDPVKKQKGKRKRKRVLIEQPVPPPPTILIRDVRDLGGKVVHIAANPEHTSMIYKLSDSIRKYINVIEVDKYEPDHLIYMVSQGSINYVICPEDVALLNKRYYDNIDIRTVVSPKFKLAWAVRKSSVKLQDTLDKWLQKYRKTNEYKHIYNKYYKYTAPVKKQSVVWKKYKFNPNKMISPFDEDIIKYSYDLGWDWRLVAALINIESRFNPRAYNSGNIGLMQLAPMTAAKLGISQESSPEQQIKAGVKYLKMLDNTFKAKIPDINTRVKFVIAAYNIGDGHVWDAIRLTEKYGRDATIWEDNVAYFLTQKSSKQYYKDPVVRFGYCNGDHTVMVIERIMTQYGHYRNTFK